MEFDGCSRLAFKKTLTKVTRMRCFIASVAAVVFLASVGSQTLTAQTWDGGGSPSFNWTLGQNWSGDVAPVPSTTAALTFAGSTGLTNTNDFTAGSVFNTLTFSAGAGAFTLGGNAINLGNGTAGTKVTNSSSNLQTIDTNLALQQTTTVSPGTGGLAIDGDVSGAFGLTHTGFGTLILSGDNSYSGPTLITSANASGTSTIRAIANAGNTTAGVSRALGNSSSEFQVNTLSPNAAAVLQLRADADTTFATKGVLFSSSAPTTNRELTINVDQATAGNSDKTLTLGGDFTFTNYQGNTIQRTLNVTGANGYGLAIGTVKAVPSSSGTAIPRINVSASGGLAIAAVSFDAAAGLEFIGSGNTTITGDISRSGLNRNQFITQNGTGSLTLEGAATNTTGLVGGGYRFNLLAGTLNINNARAIGDGADTSNANYNRVLNLGGGTLDNTSGSAITVLNNNSTNLTGLNRFELNIDGNFAFGGTNALTLNVGSGSGQGTQVGLITLGSAAGGSRTITANGTSLLTLNGGIANGGGATPSASGIVKAGNGTLVLQQSNFFTGNTSVNAGTLLVNGENVAAQTGAAGTTTTSATNAANYKITGMNSAVVANLRAGQSVSGTGIGAGAVITGILNTTSIQVSQISTADGTGNNLSFGAGSGLGIGSVTVGGTGTLGGNGSFTGALAVNSGGTLAPGASIGSLGSGALTFGTGSTFAAELDSEATLLLGADLMKVSGDLNLSGTVTLALSDLASSPVAFALDTKFSLINYAGTWNTGLFTVGGNAVANNGQFTAGLNTWQIEYNATTGGSNFAGEQTAGKFVNIVAVVPEPGTIALAAVAAAAGLAAGLRRRAAARAGRGG